MEQNAFQFTENVQGFAFLKRICSVSIKKGNTADGKERGLCQSYSGKIKGVGEKDDQMLRK